MCTCIRDINEQLAGKNGRLDWVVTVPRQGGESSDLLPMLSVSKIKPRGPKPPVPVCSFCPFCGERHEVGKC